MFDLAQARTLFALLRERFAQHEAALNVLDSEIGDGDHGFTAARAFRAAAARIERGEFHDLGELFGIAASEIAEAGGGAFGPLAAAFFAAGSAAFAGQVQADTALLSKFFACGLDGVQAVGGARPGEKTLVDALQPAAQMLAEQVDSEIVEALTQTARAARCGAAATADMVAGHGRARFLGERSRGKPDAGAESLALLVEAFRDTLQGECAAPVVSRTESVAPPSGKFINQLEQMTSEDVEGLALAYPRWVRLAEPNLLVRAAPKAEGKVGLAIGHGGGHTPSMGGFVGPGLLDADAYGPTFTCASGIRIARALELAERGAGVVLLVSNHAGDVLNARLAVHLAEQRGQHVRSVFLGDDVATAPRERLSERRGLGGLLFALKVGGAAAERGADLTEVVRLMEKTNARTATLAVAARPPTHPATGQPLFALPPGQIEIGTGVHGEAGVYRGPHLPADAVVDMMLERLVADLGALLTNRVLVFVNGAGGTSLMELHILYRRAHQALTARGCEVAVGVAGSYFTTQEMGGFSLSLCAADAELIELWHAPAHSACFHW